MTDHDAQSWGGERAGGAPRRFDLLLAVLFVLGLATPLLGLVTKVEGTGQLMENRTLAPAPGRPGSDGVVAWLGSLPAQCDAWFSDHFAFRDLLIEWNTVVSVLWLESAPEIGQVLRPGPRRFVLDPLARTVLHGREDWFYFFGPGMLDDHRGLSPMTPEELSGWQRVLERRQEGLRRRGVDYLLTIVPEKQSIYPEYLPKAVVRHGPTRAQQLVEHLRAHSSVEVLDLRPVLEEAKKEGQAYYRTGTHWNDHGALRAAQAILTRLVPAHPGLQIPRDEDFLPRSETGPARPFLALVGLRSRVRESYVFLEPRERPAARGITASDLAPTPGADLRWTYLKRATERSDLPHALVFHDSFVPAGLEPILSEHFASVAYYWRPDFKWKAVKEESPDIVIEEHAERFFLSHPDDPTRTAAERTAAERQPMEQP